MTYLTAQNIYHSYQGQKIVDGASLQVDEGEIICLLGPSGCGKSTLLRLLSGIERADEAVVEINGKIVTGKHENVPVEKRNIGMVFQNPSLFPHLNVRDNILFGVNKRDKKAVSHALSLLRKIGMEDCAGNYPQMISGGQQQRVAIARALAVRPKIMMMDEPFANLDTVLRKKIRSEFATILKEEKVATILVTHDPSEALEIADRIYVMQKGKIIQSGTPHELYNKPINSFVAEFFGELNTLDVKVRDGQINTVFGGLDLEKIACHNLGQEFCDVIANDAPVKVYIRTEAIRLTHESEGDTQAIVENIRFLGFNAIVAVRLCHENDVTLKVRVVSHKLPEIGDKVGLILDDNQAFIFKN